MARVLRQSGAGSLQVEEAGRGDGRLARTVRRAPTAMFAIHCEVTMMQWRQRAHGSRTSGGTGPPAANSAWRQQAAGRRRRRARRSARCPFALLQQRCQLGSRSQPYYPCTLRPTPLAASPAAPQGVVLWVSAGPSTADGRACNAGRDAWPALDRSTGRHPQHTLATTLTLARLCAYTTRRMRCTPMQARAQFRWTLADSLF